MKTNFRKKNEPKSGIKRLPNSIKDEKKDLTKEEFENFLLQSGAAGSFMVFRSKQKNDELGLDDL